MASPQYDSIVIGAGLSGITALWKTATQLGHKTVCLEAGSDVGGVWHWNRYPGARTDSEGTVYSLNFAPELKELWNFREKFPSQAAIQQYMASIVDYFDLRKHIQFNTYVTACHYDDASNVWAVTTKDGQTLTARYVISASGPLSVAKKVPFAGIDSFQGEWYQTSSWPKGKTAANFKGKRVAIIGTGASGVQLVPKLAAVASQLFVVQRTPNYVVPARNTTFDDDETADLRSRFDETWQLAHGNEFGVAMRPTGKTWENMGGDDTKIRQMLDKGWEAGGFHVPFENFDDVFMRPESNQVASDYIRNKIRAIVVDPQVAEQLVPTYPFLAKRPPAGHGYYETYNRPNVTLVDVSGEGGGIDVYDKGVRSLATNEEYEVDVILFALGFDAGTGALAAIDVRGSQGVSLKDTWGAASRDSLQTFAGVLTPGFPNLFMVCGPHVPFGNMPIVIEDAVKWIGQCLVHMKENGFGRVDAQKEVAAAYTAELHGIFDMAFFGAAAKEHGAWFAGSNIPGKAGQALFYFGGLSGWRRWLDAETKDDAWKSLTFAKA